MENTGSDWEVESMSTTTTTRDNTTMMRDSGRVGMRDSGRVGRRSGTPTTPSTPTVTATTVRRRSFPIPFSPDGVSIPTLTQAQAQAPTQARTLPTSAPPPSSYTYPFQPYPFQAYPGNPDPRTPIPNTSYYGYGGYGGYSRRLSSMESLSNRRRSGGFSEDSAHSNSGVGVGVPASEEVLGRPVAPFMTNGNRGGRSSRNTLYRNSAAAATVTTKWSSPNLSEGSRPGSMIFQAPFLSPPSRNLSTVWTPPAYAQHQHQLVFPLRSTTALSSLFRMTLLAGGKLSPADEPWLADPQPRERLPKILTYRCILLGLGAALLCFFDLRNLDLSDESHLRHMVYPSPKGVRYIQRGTVYPNKSSSASASIM
ncbi:hypothetical protein C8J55DRAFT_564841 [Lentinula edodes]|uniref:Uncharacterized protein n=1 Tax=Lentinula lateritia TaxID=40482 RepID=A0A9W8ZVW1_9AGAR|nr:hypothetical protein C8J55DRAFT_564841 [Lentinula edodes]